MSPARNPRKSEERPSPAFRDLLQGRTVLVGMGNPLRGDDGAGPALMRRMDGLCDCLCINAETTPENCLGLIAKQQPDTVVFIDAVDMGLAPGQWRVFEDSEMAETSLHTHGISLGLLIAHLQSHTDARIVVLGIQPCSVAFGQGISVDVETAIEEIAEAVQTARPRG